MRKRNQIQLYEMRRNGIFSPTYSTGIECLNFIRDTWGLEFCDWDEVEKPWFDALNYIIGRKFSIVAEPREFRI